MNMIEKGRYLQGRRLQGERGNEGVAVVAVEVDCSVRLYIVDCSGGSSYVEVRHIDRFEGKLGRVQQLFAPRRLRVL
jgi:hypothetical protein